MSSTNDRQSYLIDTNILIDLEDYHVIEEAYANFAKLVASIASVALFNWAPMSCLRSLSDPHLARSGT